MIKTHVSVLSNCVVTRRVSRYSCHVCHVLARYARCSSVASSLSASRNCRLNDCEINTTMLSPARSSARSHLLLRRVSWCLPYQVAAPTTPECVSILTELTHPTRTLAVCILNTARIHVGPKRRPTLQTLKHVLSCFAGVTVTFKRSTSRLPACPLEPDRCQSLRIYSLTHRFQACCSRLLGSGMPRFPFKVATKIIAVYIESTRQMVQNSKLPGIFNNF